MRSMTSPCAAFTSSWYSVCFRSSCAASRCPCCVKRASSSGLSFPWLAWSRCRRSLTCLFKFSSSTWREANCDWSSADACFPSAVLTIDVRTSITPSLFVAEEPAAGVPCADAPAAAKRHAAAKAAVRIMVVCNPDGVRVNILEFTFFSLWQVIPAKLRPPGPILHWPKLVLRSPAPSAGVIQTPQYSRAGVSLAIGKLRPCESARPACGLLAAMPLSGPSVVQHAPQRPALLRQRIQDHAVVDLVRDHRHVGLRMNRRSELRRAADSKGSARLESLRIDDRDRVTRRIDRQDRPCLQVVRYRSRVDPHPNRRDLAGIRIERPDQVAVALCYIEESGRDRRIEHDPGWRGRQE